MRSIDVAGFEAKFAGDGDPWSTWTDRDEAVKRRAILHALGPGPLGRVLELGAGNGSNSLALARRALRLDATEATASGTDLVAAAIACHAPRARASMLVVPEAPPRSAYDAVVVAELLYYLDARAMAQLARQVVRLLRPGGQLVLAHHRITFYDFAQHAEGIHDRFLHATGTSWRKRDVRRTGRWSVLAGTLACRGSPELFRSRLPERLHLAVDQGARARKGSAGRSIAGGSRTRDDGFGASRVRDALEGMT